jgi:hypothetical protein
MIALKVFFACLSLGVGLTVGHALYEQLKDTPYPEADYLMVCQQLAIELNAPEVEKGCRGLTRPQIVISPIVRQFDRFGAQVRGMYFKGDKYIFIRDGLNERQVRDTTIHETVHYVIHNLGYQFDVCEHERLARKIAKNPWDDRVKKLYGCGPGQKPRWIII